MGNSGPHRPFMVLVYGSCIIHVRSLEEKREIFVTPLVFDYSKIIISIFSIFFSFSKLSLHLLDQSVFLTQTKSNFLKTFWGFCQLLFMSQGYVVL